MKKRSLTGTYVVAMTLLLSAVSSLVLTAGTKRVIAANVTVTNTNDNGPGSLRNAIATTAPGDTITFSNTTAGGATNFFDGSAHTITLSTGELFIARDLTIQGPGANLLTVARDDAAGRFGIFLVFPGTIVNISGITITKGFTADAVSAGVFFGVPGGGIRNTGMLTLNGVAVIGNRTGRGADAAPPGDGGSGGGIYNESGATLTILNCTISNNQAGAGGNNTSSGAGGFGGSGGGIYNESGAALTIINSTVSGNQTGAGGNGTSVPVPGSGGGIYNEASLKISNSTIAFNTAGAGNGGGMKNAGGSITLKSTIVGANAAGTAPDIQGDVTSDGFNLIQTISGTISPNSGAGADITGGDPLLNPLADNGGTTQTHSLQSNSPAIDQGKDFAATSADQRGLTRPFDLINANATGGDGTDIGAYEINDSLSTLEVNSVADTNDGVCAPIGTGNGCTLREAIIAANADLGAETITFNSTVFALPGPHSIILLSALPDIAGDLTITGPGATVLSVERDVSATTRFRIFTITSGTVAISGLTVTKGFTDDGLNSMPLGSPPGATSPAGSGGVGGGIFNSGTLTLSGIAVSGNRTGKGGDSSSLPGAGGLGGGVYNLGTLTITNSTISGNKTGAGGISGGGAGGSGGLGGGIMNAAGTLTLTNSTVSNNQTGAGGSGTSTGSGGDGGGIWNISMLTVGNSTIAVNQVGTGRGAGIRTIAGTTTLKSTIVGANLPSDNDVDGNVQSDGFNLIQSITGGTITPNPGAGPSIIGQSPQLKALADNGGPTMTHLLQPGSPAIDKGNAFGLTEDQRGFARSAGATVDIGSVEVNYTISTTLGTPQSTAINTSFSNQLKATVQESGITQSDLPVTFTAPASGPSGTFTGGATSVSVNANALGVATAPVLTANGIPGSYNVVASIGLGLPTASFALTNLKANQTITFGALPNKTFGGADFPLNPSPTASSGLPVSLSTNGQCTVTGPPPSWTVHLTGAGSCAITATQDGDSFYNAAPSVMQSFSIAKSNQTITFGPLANRTFGEADFVVSATASSNLAVSLAAGGQCTVTSPSPGTVHLTGAGACLIEASQAGDSNYNAATNVQQTFVIAKANQTITFGPLGNKTFGDADFVVSGTVNSNLAVSLAASGQCTVTTPSPGTVHLTGAGSCTITASQSGDPNYNAAANVPQSFSIAKSNQTITFGPLGNKTFGDADFVASPTASSNQAVSLTASGQCTVTTPSPGTIHLTGAGSCTITAKQGGDSNYNAAANVPQSFTIAQAGTATTLSSSPNPSNLTQNVTFTATVTSAAGTPSGTVVFKDGGNPITCTNAGGQTLDGSGVATCQSASLSAATHTITADYSGDANFLVSRGMLSGGQIVNNRPLIKFSQSNYAVNENGKFVTITVNRSGDTSPAVNVDYATPDDSAAMTVLPCSTANGVASPRCDFTTALGTLRFAPGETSKTFDLLISQDTFVEGPETFTLALTNLTGGAGFAQPSDASAVVTITDDDFSASAINAIDDTETFVRQHYHDFLNREPDASGLAFWKDNIDKCNDPARRPAALTLAQCIEVFRINTSAAFFLSIEFQNTGYFVERIYKSGFGDINPPNVPVPVRFTNFMADTQQIGAGVIVGQNNWQAQLDSNKSAFALSLVQRSSFVARYPASTSATALVDSLNLNAGNVLSGSERLSLISELSPNPSDPALRASVLRKVSDNALLQQREFNRAFVLMQYLGYLRRNPDAAPELNLNFDGFNFWLSKMNTFNGDYIKAEMVKAFTNSSEYRQRFGP